MQQSVARAFLDAVDRYRSSVAVIAQDRTWNYEELGRLTGAVLRYIKSTDVKQGDRIALLLPNCGEYVATCFGTHLAGCAVVALNTQEPAPVLARIMEHCGARLLFADASNRELDKLRALTASNGLQIVDVGKDSAEWSEICKSESGDYRQHVVETRPEDLASIIYTSGTTGNPKGVMLSHRNLVANTESILQYIDIGPDDRTFNVLPFYYSFGNSILLTHLIVGACIILQNNVAFPHAVMKRMGEEGTTGFYGVPTTFALLFETDRIASADLSSLRYIAQAGGPMSVAKQQQLARDLPHVDIIVMYGQTEATARLTYLEPEQLVDKFGSVGKGIPGVEIRVGHTANEAHSEESPGEVCARGDNIMMGYWNNPEATAEVVQDGWLCTGDLGYFDSDGYLFLTGRSSDMIKTGANRVSPSEIEDVIIGFEEVAEVCAFGIDDEILGQAVAVAIVLAEGALPDEQDIRRRCLEELSHYKVPKTIRFVKSLPKTSSGKLKRHVLAKEHKEAVESE